MNSTLLTFARTKSLTPFLLLCECLTENTNESRENWWIYSDAYQEAMRLMNDPEALKAFALFRWHYARVIITHSYESLEHIRSFIFELFPDMKRFNAIPLFKLQKCHFCGSVNPHTSKRDGYSGLCNNCEAI